MPNDALISETVARWRGRDRPLFKGSLIDTSEAEACYCAQGDILHHAGWTDCALEIIAQSDADIKVANHLGISVAHSVLLRVINDSRDGCPEGVLSAPENILGDQAHLVLAFWHHLDRMSHEDWVKFSTFRTAARTATMDAARAVAMDAAMDAAGGDARAVARVVARAVAWTVADASNEIQGAVVMQERGQSLFFLPMFGINDPEELRAEK